MNVAQCRVTIRDRVRDDAKGDQVVHLLEGNPLTFDLLVNAVKPFDAGLDHFERDLGIRQRPLQGIP